MDNGPKLVRVEEVVESAHFCGVREGERVEARQTSSREKEEGWTVRAESTQEVGGSKVFMPIATVDPKDVVLRCSPSTARGRRRR